MSESLTFSELESAAKQTETAIPAATSTETTQETKPTEQVAEKPQFTDADVDAYRQLSDLGINPQNAREFIAAKAAIDNLPNVMKSPNGLRAMMDEIQKHDPTAYKMLLENISDRWYSELPEEVRKGSGTSTESRSTATVSDPRIDALTAKLDELTKERETERQRQAQQTVAEGYEKALTTVIGKLPEGVTERDKEYIRLKANELIWKDEKARDRVAKGNYTDVPSYIAKASAFLTADTKAASDKEAQRREAQRVTAGKEIVPAADTTAGAPAQKQETHSHYTDKAGWGNITPEEIKSAYR